MTATFDALDPRFEERVRDSFDKQAFMRTVGATLTRVEPGVVDIELPFDEALTQQHGFLHAGAITTIVDSACGYAALSLMPAGAAVLTVEFKVNLLSPARGGRFVAMGRVKKRGGTLLVCEGDVIADPESAAKPIATMLATVMCVQGRGLTD